MTQNILALFTLLLSAYVDPFEEKLWPSGVPGSEGSVLEVAVCSNEIQVDGRLRISREIEKVTDPTLTEYLPGGEKRSGIALLIRPRGGFRGLEFDKEGTEIVRWQPDRMTGV